MNVLATPATAGAVRPTLIVERIPPIVDDGGEEMKMKEEFTGTQSDKLRVYPVLQRPTQPVCPGCGYENDPEFVPQMGLDGKGKAVWTTCVCGWWEY